MAQQTLKENKDSFLNSVGIQNNSQQFQHTGLRNVKIVQQTLIKNPVLEELKQNQQSNFLSQINQINPQTKFQQYLQILDVSDDSALMVKDEKEEKIYNLKKINQWQKEFPWIIQCQESINKNQHQFQLIFNNIEKALQQIGYLQKNTQKLPLVKFIQNKLLDFISKQYYSQLFQILKPKRITFDDTFSVFNPEIIKNILTKQWVDLKEIFLRINNSWYHQTNGFDLINLIQLADSQSKQGKQIRLIIQVGFLFPGDLQRLSKMEIKSKLQLKIYYLTEKTAVSLIQTQFKSPQNIFITYSIYGKKPSEEAQLQVLQQSCYYDFFQKSHLLHLDMESCDKKCIMLKKQCKSSLGLNPMRTFHAQNIKISYLIRLYQVQKNGKFKLIIFSKNLMDNLLYQFQHNQLLYQFQWQQVQNIQLFKYYDKLSLDNFHNNHYRFPNLKIIQILFTNYNQLTLIHSQILLKFNKLQLLVFDFSQFSNKNSIHLKDQQVQGDQSDDQMIQNQESNELFNDIFELIYRINQKMKKLSPKFNISIKLKQLKNQQQLYQLTISDKFKSQKQLIRYYKKRINHTLLG